MPLCAASHLDFTLTPASTRIHISSPKPVVPMAGCRTVNSFQFECPPVIRRTRPWRFEGVLEVAELSMPATCTVHAEVFGLHVPVGDAQPLQPGQKIPVIAGFSDARLRTAGYLSAALLLGLMAAAGWIRKRTSGDSNLVRSVFDHWFWTTRSLAAFLIGWAGLVLWFHVPLFVNLMLDGSRIAPIAGGLLIAAPMLLMQKLIARWSYPAVPGVAGKPVG